MTDSNCCEIAVLADDLTGSLASAARLREGGLRPLLLWQRQNLTSWTHDALVANMRTRDWAYPAAQTAAAWAAHLRRLGCRRLELRTDSTLRGNPAAELYGLIRGAGIENAWVLAVPAFPAAGRITVEGRQRVVTGPGWSHLDADVSTVLFGAQTARIVSLDEISSGPAAVAQVMLKADTQRFIADATEDWHLEVVAQAVAFLEEKGIEVVTVSPGAWLRYHPVRRARQSGFVLVVIASPTEQNLRQLEVLLTSGAIARAITVEQDSADTEVVNWAEVQNRSVVIVETVHATGNGRDRALLAAMVASRLLEEARTQGRRCRAVVVSGGHTAACLVDLLGSTAVQPLDEVRPLCPRGVLLGGPWDGLVVATKGGLVGEGTTLLEIVRAVGG